MMLLWVALAAACLQAADESPLVARLCMDCHSSAARKGDFDLQKLGVPSGARLADWEKVRSNLADGSMPPRGKPQPTPPERERLIAWIDRALDGPEGAKPEDPGPAPLRRLTRLEINRTLKELLGAEGSPADALPPDSAGGSGTFENNADTLFISPLLMERMLDLALELIRKAKPDKLNEVAVEKDKTGKETPALRRKAAELALTGFLPRAWRRPVPSTEVRNHLRAYDRGVERKLSHEDALLMAYAAALISPNFLYRLETAQSGNGISEITPYELAVRLSYLFWSAPPDAELTAAAANGSLSRDPKVHARQIDRLLADPRAGVFRAQFMGQWLGTSDLAGGRGPDPKAFPDYTPALRASMAEEPAALFELMLREDRSLLELIEADYVVADATLARIYELPFPGGDGFHRIAAPGGRRGGVATMAGVLAATSRPSRTSPVLRGKWILEELLSTPPPPPPANVPALPEDRSPNLGSLRQRLERHRADPNCTSCHVRIDPLGFGLENFDALGRWREQGEMGEALDVLGTLPGGQTFRGPQELKRVLMQRKEKVMTTVVERMLAFAVGRNLERSDRPVVRQILSRLAADGWKTRTLVSEVVTSLPFRYRRNAGWVPPSVSRPKDLKEKTP